MSYMRSLQSRISNSVSGCILWLYAHTYYIIKYQYIPSHDALIYVHMFIIFISSHKMYIALRNTRTVLYRILASF